MKVERVSEHIWSVRTWLLVPVRVWVVGDQEGLTLVDAGIARMAKGILKLVEQLDAGPLRRIVLTHGHPDHVGAVKPILKTNRVPVLAHRVEIRYMEGELAYPGRKRASKNVERGVAQPLAEDPNGDLQVVAGLKPYHTPGHAPGHVVYYHEKDDVLLAGDLFTSKRGRLRRPMPMFTSDMAEALRSGAIVTRIEPRRLEVCHGSPVFHPADQWASFIDTVDPADCPPAVSA